MLQLPDPFLRYEFLIERDIAFGYLEKIKIKLLYFGEIAIKKVDRVENKEDALKKIKYIKRELGDEIIFLVSGPINNFISNQKLLDKELEMSYKIINSIQNVFDKFILHLKGD